MKFAFSTVSCPKWDFETIVARAKEYGYDGVEVRGFLNESIMTASNPFLTDPAKLRRMFEGSGLEVACLASSIAFQKNRRADTRSADDLKRFIDAAAALGCGIVKIFDTHVQARSMRVPWRGQSRSSAGVSLGDWLLPFGDYAARQDVVIVIENALSFRDSKEMWAILDRLQHPSIACCWDVFNAAQIGEAPSFSVPTLNSKIAYTQVKDAKFGALGTVFTKLGEGDVQVEKFLRRLRGIGYRGWVSVEWEKAWLPNIAEPEEILPDAIKKLKEWMKSGADEEAESDAEPAGVH
ncbi:MAG: sugar phosphate isomerase/epimerase family protein [Tepidisphaeraceae bacterium]